jgi:hypothetical protein
MPDVLPGYRFSTQSQRYISQSTGRFVARREITGLLDAQVRGSESRIANLVTAYHERKVSASVFVEQMSAELKRQHLQNRALGAGGWDRLTQADYGAIGGKIRGDYKRVEQLARDIADGKATLPQALNRANGYVGNARTDFWDAERQRMEAKPGNVLLEARTLGAAEHCEDCVNFYQQGWQRQGVLPSPGVDSQCGTHCKCNMIYKEINILIVGEYIGTRK